MTGNHPQTRPCRIDSFSRPALPAGSSAHFAQFNGGHGPPAKRRSRAAAFTLTEMLVVIGIIVLMIGIAIPAIRALTGNRNVGAAYNQVSAIIGQARQDAMSQASMYPYHGVIFFLDPSTDRVNALFVEGEYPPTPNGAQVWIDETPGREQVALANGVGLEAIANPPNSTSPRYLGFQPSLEDKFGGLILFDSNGRLVNVSFCLLCSTPVGVFGGSYNSANPSQSVTIPNSTTAGSAFSTAGYPQSAFGFVLFDRDAFLNNGNTDGDYGYDPSVSSYSPAKDIWLDANSTPVLINRYNGTLIKGE